MNEILNTAHPGKTNQPGRRKQVTTNTCPITGQPLKNPGDTVHPDAWDNIMPWLADLNTYMQALQDALGKKPRIHDPNTGKPAIPDSTVPIALGLLEPAWIIRHDLLTWTNEAAKHIGTSTPATWGTIGAFWKIHRNTLTRWILAPQAIDELEDALRITLRIIDRRPTTSILGLCPNCQQPIYIPKHRKDDLTCQKCQTRFSRAEARTKAIQAIAYKWLPADQALPATELITGQPAPNIETLRTWGKRGKIEVRPYIGRNLYQPIQIARHTENPETLEILDKLNHNTR